MVPGSKKPITKRRRKVRKLPNETQVLNFRVKVHLRSYESKMNR